MKKVLTITLVMLLVGLIGLTACGGPSLTEQDIATIRGFGTRIDNLEAAVASLNSKLANLNTSTLQTDVNQAKTDIAAIKTELEQLTPAGTENKSKIDALTVKVTELEARMKALEDKLGGETTVSQTTTRWSLEIFFDPDLPSDVTFETSIYPTRIREEDTYRITMVVSNNSVTAVNKTVSMTAILTPSSKDTMVNEVDTFLDYISPSSITLEDFNFTPEPKNNVSVNCRRIEFISDDFTLKVPAKTDDTPGTYIIKLDFNLSYAGD